MLRAPACTPCDGLLLLTRPRQRRRVQQLRRRGRRRRVRWRRARRSGEPTRPRRCSARCDLKPQLFYFSPASILLHIAGVTFFFCEARVSSFSSFKCSCFVFFVPSPLTPFFAPPCPGNPVRGPGAEPRCGGGLAAVERARGRRPAAALPLRPQSKGGGGAALLLVAPCSVLP